MFRALFPAVSVVVAGCYGDGRDHEAGVTSKWLTCRCGGACGGALNGTGAQIPVHRSSFVLSRFRASGGGGPSFAVNGGGVVSLW
jgi:hypothetical protein